MRHDFRPFVQKIRYQHSKLKLITRWGEEAKKYEKYCCAQENRTWQRWFQEKGQKRKMAAERSLINMEKTAPTKNPR